MRQIDILWKKRALKFIDKNRNNFSMDSVNDLVLLSIRKHILGENIFIDSIPLKGKLSGNYRIRKGNVRIIFFISENSEIIIEAIVENIDFRGDIYK